MIIIRVEFFDQTKLFSDYYLCSFFSEKP